MPIDPTKTTEMHGLWDTVTAWLDEPSEPPQADRVTQLEATVRRLHAWVTFCVVLVLGMTALTIVTLLQLGGWIRWFG